METITLTLDDKQAKALRAGYSKADTTSAVQAVIVEGLERAKLRKTFPRPHVPNAATARALRAPASSRDRVFDSAADAKAYLRKILNR